jgi:hypothetical protein
MARFDLNLPIDIPWMLIASSPDMIDTRFCNKQFPFGWRSSLALSVYEPKLEDLPEELCGQRITYLKVTASITGFQASQEEAASLQGQSVNFGDVPVEEVDRILDEYWACYGVMLNVAAFPVSNTMLRPRTARADFSVHAPGIKLANPHTVSGMTFEVAGRASNPVVDLVPAGGDGKGELDLGSGAEVGIPTSTRVTARVAFVEPPEMGAGGAGSAAGARLKVEFYQGTSLTAVRELSTAPDAQTLAIEGDGLTRVVFQAEGGLASLLELTAEGADRVPVGLEDYPHIVDFEPKSRDLYQASTETGEVLTASDTRVNAGKSHVRTATTQTGLSFLSKSRSGSETIFSESSLGLTHQWGDTEQDSNVLQAEASRERRERQATSTTLSQMYNLLTGYHLGTNRALFLMLPRPHLQQPTDRRSFVQGLRVIEGIQEFLLIIVRPGGMEGLCLEAYLETGHFPEKVTEEQPQRAESTRDFDVTVHAGNGLFSGELKTIQDQPQSLYTVPAGWIIDQSKGDPGHPGVSQVAIRGNQRGRDTLRAYTYRAISDTQAQVFGTIEGAGGLGPGAIFDRTYRVFLISQQPPEEPAKVTTPFLVTSRGLCACFLGGDCPRPLVIGFPVDTPEPPGEVPPVGGAPGLPPIDIPPPMVGIQPQSPYAAAPASSESLVEERTIEIEVPITAEARLPGVKELLRTVQSLMATSWRSPYRVPRGSAGLLDTDYATKRLMRLLPKQHLAQPVNRIPDLPPAILKAFGPEATVGEVLATELRRLAHLTGLDMAAAVRARRLLLGLQPQPRKPPDGVLRPPVKDDSEPRTQPPQSREQAD